MLERFKVPKEDEVRVPESSLRETVTAIFEKMGVSPEDAAEAADVLVSTDLRGVETHGVSNTLRGYVRAYSEGTLNPRPNWKLVTESPGTAVMDADNGLAVILGPKAMRIAIEKARNVGLGMVSMFNYSVQHRRVYPRGYVQREYGCHAAHIATDQARSGS